MSIEVITKEDLREFRMLLLNDIKQLVIPKEASRAKPWLKNGEVRQLLHISSNTLQRLRISGKLRSSKIGGIHFYKYEDIEKLINSGIEKR
jgi:hypothetical protein